MKKLKVLFFIFLGLGLLSMPSAAYDNSKSNYQCLPEVIWAPASGGGTWVTAATILSWNAGTVLSAYFDYGTGWRLVSNWYTLPNVGSIVQTGNLLYTLDYYDSGAFDYYGRVGAVEIWTQDENHKIQITAKTTNGNYGKTFPGLNKLESNTIAVGRPMMIPFAIKNSTWRSTIGVFNYSGSSMVLRVYIMDNNYVPFGDYDITVPAWNFIAHDPYAYAGLTGTYSNGYILLWPQSGAGVAFCFGATANNVTNDPSALIPQQVN